MDHKTQSLSSLIGSRICHDLISPIGAIVNGLELLEMAGQAPGPELALIGDSAENAGARIRFFRIAFGVAGEEIMPEREILKILGDLQKGGRVRIDWEVSGDVARTEVRMAFLALQCLETALAYGGHITVVRAGAGWELCGCAERLQLDGELWSDLTRDMRRARITPALVQFALLPDTVREGGTCLQVETTETSVAIRF